MTTAVEQAWRGRWAGRTVAVIASGPSLTAEDCERVRGLPAVVTNTTFRMCPWADALMGFDQRFWRRYHDEVIATFPGERFAFPVTARAPGVTVLQYETWFRSFNNSGTDAISLAVEAGAKRVLLLGCDCQKDGKRVHWHGDHPVGMSNAQSIATWPAKFERVAKFARSKGVQVINCSRSTALRCFDRMDLEAALS